MEAIERLKKMINKPFLYNGEEVIVLNYCDGCGESGNETEIYLNNGKTICLPNHDLKMVIERFKPITNTVVILANERLNQVSTVNPAIIQEMRDIVLNQIRELKGNKDAVPVSKQVFQGVNTLINLAKTELDYKRYLDKAQK